jgi:hypothetical protein
MLLGHPAVQGAPSQGPCLRMFIMGMVQSLVLWPMVKEPTPRVRELRASLVVVQLEEPSLRAVLLVVHSGARGLEVVLKAFLMFSVRSSLQMISSQCLRQSQVSCIRYFMSKFMILHSLRQERKS